MGLTMLQSTDYMDNFIEFLRYGELYFNEKFPDIFSVAIPDDYYNSNIKFNGLIAYNHLDHPLEFLLENKDQVAFARDVADFTVHNVYQPLEYTSGFYSIGFDFWDWQSWVWLHSTPGYFEKVIQKKDLTKCKYDFLVLMGVHRQRRVQFAQEFFKKKMHKTSLVSIIPHHYSMIDIPNDLNEWDSYEEYLEVYNVKKYESHLHPELPGIRNPSAIGTHIHRRMYEDCKVKLVLESSWTEDKPSISEKLFQSIIQLTPFVVFGNPNYLARLHDKGFKTFGDIIDESYDTELDIKKRLDKFFVAAQQLVEVYDDPRVQSICEHNQKHFLNPYRINNELKEFYAEVNKVKKNV